MIRDPIAAAIIARLELSSRANFCRMRASMTDDQFIAEALYDFAALLDRMAAHISAKADACQPNHERTSIHANR